MERIYLALVFLILFDIANAQDFCGVIRYKYTYYRGKSNKDVTNKIDDVKTEEFFICGNKFKICFDGRVEDILIGDSSTYFMFYRDSTVRYVKADTAYGQPPPHYGEIKDVIYKGKRYKLIEEKSKKQSLSYYFNDDVKINPELFRNVEMFHWNKYFAATNGSLRLLSENKTGRLTSVSEAIEIKKMALQDIDFALPPGFKLVPWKNLEVSD